MNNQKTTLWIIMKCDELFILVIESHPEHQHPDLRLLNPFPELVSFCDGINLDILSKKDHSHVPWLVIVYKFLQLYKSQVGIKEWIICDSGWIEG